MSDPSPADTCTPSPDTTPADAFPTDAETETIRRAIRALGQRPTITEAIAANVARINELLRPFHALARDADGGDPAVALKNGWVLNPAKGLRKPNFHNAGRDIDLGTCAFPAAVLREVLTELSDRALRTVASEEGRLRTLAATVNALAGEPVTVPRVVESGPAEVPASAPGPRVGEFWECVLEWAGAASPGDVVRVREVGDVVTWSPLDGPNSGCWYGVPLAWFLKHFRPARAPASP